MFKSPRAFAPRLGSFVRMLGAVFFLLVMVGSASAGPITVQNGSFESPTTFFVTLNLDGWQRTPEPSWWDTNTSGQWDTLIGFFKNTPPGAFDHIDNCHGNQAMWLFVQPEAGLFQDYDSVDWNDTTPTHAFDASFEVGKSYQLTVGLLVGGMGSGGGIQPGATVDFSLYYRDAASNRVAVATTTITNSPLVFSNSTHLLDFPVNVPTVRAGDAWAGQHIGILLLSTVATNLVGGYWDLDNVRLTSTLAPTLLNPVRTNNQFQFTIQSEPGMILEILAATNATLPTLSWTSLGTLTNSTGTIPFIDTSANFDQRFYQARQLP
ncbi:MAG: hypothetical protein AAB370_08465 [Verrucomicrobiota bacterium]